MKKLEKWSLLIGVLCLIIITIFSIKTMTSKAPESTLGNTYVYSSKTCDSSIVTVNPNTTTTVLAGFSARQWAVITNTTSVQVWLGMNSSTVAVNTGFVINTATPQFTTNLVNPYIGIIYGLSPVTTSVSVNQCY